MHLSLRVRLLVAAGVVVIAGLAVADLTTYAATKSLLIGRVDQQLDGASVFYESQLAQGVWPGCAGPGSFVGPGGAAESGSGGSGGGTVGGGVGSGPRLPNAVQVSAVEVVTSSGAVVAGEDCPAYVNDRASLPQLNVTLAGLGMGASTTAGGGDVLRFTTGSTGTSGEAMRVRADRLSNGNILVVAQPLDSVSSTLTGLAWTELWGSLAVLVAAGLLGWWLIGVGLAPLEEMETVAAEIAESDLPESVDDRLEQRVPGEDERGVVGHLARTLNVMLGKIDDAFGARSAAMSRASAREEQMRRFVADASHELRTPLAAVSAYAELFERGAKDRPDDLARVMAGISSETDRMSALVRDLMLLARLDEGVVSGPREVIDVTAAAGDVVARSVAVGPAWPVRLVAHGPVEVCSDAAGLAQVLDNLVGNVRAHTPEGTAVTVTVEAVPEENGASGARIVVSDDGPGMDANEASHAFERFWRAESSRVRPGDGGSGLGLSIVDGLVKRMGGTVVLESRLGEGTVVTVTLPGQAETSSGLASGQVGEIRHG